MRNLIISVLIAAALALVAWLAFPVSAPSEPVARTAEGSSQGVSGPDVAAPDIPVDEAAPDDDAQRTPVSEDGPRNATSREAQLEFSGTIVLVGFDGVERSVAAGSFQLLGWHGNGARRDEVRIENGRWTAQVAERAFAGIDSFAIESVVTDGAPAVLVRPPGRFERDSLGGLEIVARERPRSTLRVFDRETGLELAGLEVVRGDAGMSGDRHPGSDYAKRVLEHDARSPLDLDAIEAQFGAHPVLARYTIRASGYAWASIQVDNRQGGELALSLVPGGDVEVVLIGARPAAAARLRLRQLVDVPRQPVLDDPLGERSTVVLEGLLPGKYAVEVGLGEWWSPGARFGGAEFELVAGAQERVAIDLQALEPAPYAQLAGVVLVPQAWRAQTVRLTWDYAGDARQGQDRSVELVAVASAAAPGGFAAFEFAHPKLQVGPYDVEVRQFGVARRVELPPGGLSGLTIEIGAPVEVRVAVVDDASEGAVPGASLSWSCLHPADVLGSGYLPGRLDPASGRFIFQAPAGELELSASAEGFEFQRVRLSATLPGPVDYTLRMQRICGISLALFDGDTQLLFPDGFAAEVIALGHDGAVSSWSSGAFVRAYSLTAPGAYRVKIPQLSGYEPVPDQVVDVLPQRVYALELHLQRE